MLDYAFIRLFQIGIDTNFDNRFQKRFSRHCETQSSVKGSERHSPVYSGKKTNFYWHRI